MINNLRLRLEFCNQTEFELGCYFTRAFCLKIKKLGQGPEALLGPRLKRQKKQSRFFVGTGCFR